MIEIHEALERIHSAVAPLGDETVALVQAHGRVLSEAVAADRDYPPTDRSAMDGYAVRAADLAVGRARLKLVGELRAGSPPGRIEVVAGTAVRIMTGAIVPEGADAVVMVERCVEDRIAGFVELTDRPDRGQHIRRRGEDLRQGESVLSAGVPIRAVEIAALASVGRTRVRVTRRPEVRVLSTGDEIVEPDLVPLAHQVRNSNAYSLLAQLAEIGLSGRYLGIAPDTADGLRMRLREGLEGDVLLITGGVSAGKYDLVGEVLEQEGLRLLFHGVSMKPGKPILVGSRGGCLVVGLPGNPLSTFTGFAVIVAPALRRMAGHARPDNVAVDVVLRQSLEVRPGRPTFHLARIESVGGTLQGAIVESRGSGDVLSMARANGFLRTPAEGGVFAIGDKLPALAWRDASLC